MIKPAASSAVIVLSDSPDGLDDVLDEFERRWSYGVTESRLIEECLKDFQLTESPTAVVELIRIEIDRRYARGLSVELRDYLARFPVLKDDPQRMGALAFEDFRSRNSRGLECSPARWSWIAGTAEALWFRGLRASETGSPPNGSGQAGEDRESSAAGSGKPESAGIDDHDIGPSAPRVGDRLGDFELIELLGKGSFSRVFLARQTSLDGRRVAVKVVTRPMQEPSNLARLLHSGIIPLYSYHRIEPYWLLCMPYAGSVTLADWMKVQPSASSRTGQSLVRTVVAAKRRVAQQESTSVADEDPVRPVATAETQSRSLSARQPLDQVETFDPSRLVLWFYRRLSDALAHAHQRGVIHGDVKPANVLVCNDGEPALIDFNLSHAGDEANRSWVGGTIRYMAPEQWRALCGQTNTVGPAADVYSLAAVIYELAEGRLPYPSPRSSRTEEILATLRAGAQAAPPTFRSRMTPGLAAILTKSLAIDPSQRYPTAVELAEDLGRESRDEPLRFTPESLWCSRVPKFARRHPRLCSATTAALFAVACLIGSWFAINNYRERAGRLATVESLAEFYRHSDQALVASLVDPSTDSQRRPELTQRAFIHAPMVLPIGDTRRGIAPELRDDEQARVHERLFLLAILDFLEQLQTAAVAPARCNRNAIHQSVSVIRELPNWARTSRSFWTLCSLSSKLPLPEPLGITLPTESPPLAAHPIDRLSCAILLVKQERYTEAQEFLDQPQLAESEGAAYWLTLGRTHLGNGALPDAVLSFTLCIGLRPDLAASYLNRANAHFRLGKLIAARDDFSKALSIEPGSVMALVNRSYCHAALNDHKLALADVEAALRIVPESNRLLIIRSRYLKRLGRDTEAAESFARARTSKPQSVEDWVALGLGWLPENPQSAADALREAETQFGTEAMILQSLAHVYSEHLHDEPRAIETLDRLLRQQPTFLKALAGRGVLRARAGLVDEAITDVRAIESQGGQPPAEIEYQLACIHALSSREQESLIEPGLIRLASALRRGYGADLLDSDHDLDSFRRHSGFQSLKQSSRLFRR